MSIKSTIVHGDKFHLYTELLDQKNVCFEITGVHFEANEGQVMLEIPVAIWEIIRQYSVVDFSLVGKSDQDLLVLVENNVRDRIHKYESASKREKPIFGLTGSIVYGSINETKEEQIVNGLEYFRNLRDHQFKVKKEIADFKKN